MKNFFSGLLGSLALLLPISAAYAQVSLPVPYLVASPCPGSAGNPSLLLRVPPVGVPLLVGTVNVAGTGIVVNGLASDNADPLNVYAMSSVTGGGLAALQPPQFYRISLANALATPLGTITPPPAPVVAFPQTGRSFVINQAADGGPNSKYYLTGASLVYNFITNSVSNVQLYFGEINLAPVPSPVAPIWRLVNTSDPTAVTIINNLTTQANANLAGNGPIPDGGFQDIAYVAATGNVITYLGIEQKFVVLSNINTAPVVTVITPAVLLPTGGGSPLQIGSIYRTGTGEFFGLRSATARAYQIDPITGNYLGVTYFASIGCTLGDGTTAPGVIVLPLTLTDFAAKPTAGGVQLTWQTASEKEVDRFVVERSADNRKWTDGPAVAATNQMTGARYQALDQGEPMAMRYYRLRMEDRDGTRTWSDVRTVSTSTSGAVTMLPAWPNPARNSVTMAFSAAVAGEAQLVNQLGQVVWRGSFTNGRAEADVRTLTSGVYELVARFGAGERAHQRVVITRE